MTVCLVSSFLLAHGEVLSHVTNVHALHSARFSELESSFGSAFYRLVSVCRESSHDAT